jgi:hypothetical protein
MGLPDLQLPDLSQVIDHVALCLSSGSLGSTQCGAVVQSLDLLQDLQEQCERMTVENQVCTVVLAVPNLEDILGGLLGSGSGSGPLGLFGTSHVPEPDSGLNRLMGATV